MLKGKESSIQTFLLKEALLKREFDKRKFVNSYLFHESEEFLNELTKEAMSRSAGGSTLANSGWNTNWDFVDPSSRISAIQEEIETTFGHYFHSLIGGKQHPIKAGIQISQDTTRVPGMDVEPGSIYFRFKYRRSIIPISGVSEGSQQANQKAENAISALDEYLQGFRQFQDDIQSLDISLKPFCHVSDFNTTEQGALTQDGIVKFVNSQRENNPSSPYFIKHQEEIDSNGRLRFTQGSPKPRIFNNSDIKNIGTITSLITAIANKMDAGYTINEQELRNTIRGFSEERIKSHNLDRNSADKKTQGYIATYESYYNELAEDLLGWFGKRSSTGKVPSQHELTTQDARLILGHLTVPTIPNPKIGPNEFLLKLKTNHISNGWDSGSRNPEDTVKTLPPLRQLPDGEVVYDRGNGNLSYDHLVLNWNGGLDRLFQTWGTQCQDWLKNLPNIIQAISQESPEAAEAIQNILNNSTSAEGLQSVLNKYSTFSEFKDNHLDKSLYSEISTVASINKNLTRTPSNIILPKSSDPQFIKTSIMKQINDIGRDIISLYQSNPNSAGKLFDRTQSDLVKLYNKQDVDWDLLTLGLKGLNNIKKSYGILSSLKNNIGDQREEEKNTKLSDENGFQALQQHGYAVAKIMDLLSASMIRSCEEIVNTRKDGRTEKFYGHQYSVSSGKSEGGEIILSVRYAYAPPELTNNEDIQKKIRHEQSRRHVRSRDIVQRQTLHPQNADPTGRFTDPNKPETEVGEFTPMPGEEKPVVKIVENVEYFLGQAAGKSRFAKTIRHGLPWKQMLDVFMQQYPDIGDQLGVVFEPMNANLEKLELASKRAIDKVRGEFEVLYTNNDGEDTVLSTDTLNAETVSQGEDIPEAAMEEAVKSNTPQPEMPTKPQQPQQEWTKEYDQPQIDIPQQPEIIDAREPNTNLTVPQIEEKKPMVNSPMAIKGPIPGPIAPVPQEPAPSFIGKPKNKRRLIRETPRRMGSIEDRLQKVANKLDSYGLSKLADKIDILLSKLREILDV